MPCFLQKTIRNGSNGVQLVKVAFQMDPIANVDPKADSTFRLAEEAQLRGRSLFYYEPNKLTLEDGRAIASGHFFEITGQENKSVKLEPEEIVELRDFDVVWLRQDPPFDMHYITTTFILDVLKSKTLVVNNPFWVRNLPEKLFVLNFPELIPPTTIARSIDVLKSFKEKVAKILIHGFLHLLGFDHKKNKDYSKMLKEENQIFKSVQSKIN